MDITLIEGNNQLNVEMTPITLGFTFGLPQVTVEPSKVAGLSMSTVTCTITNNSSAAITRLIRCLALYSEYEEYQAIDRVWYYEVGHIRELLVTLDPGQTEVLTSPAEYSYPPGGAGYMAQNYPTIQPGQQFYYWLEDELGNESERVLA